MIKKEDKHLPHLIAYVKGNVRKLEGQQVIYTEIRGRTRILYKGVLTGVYDKLGTISLDKDVHNYDSYSFNYTHLLLGEGALMLWDKENDENLTQTRYVIPAEEEEGEEEDSETQETKEK